MNTSQASAAGAFRPLTRMFAFGMVLLGAFAHQAGAQAVCEATDHGMRADGSDNVAALRKTLAECAGQGIHFAHGMYTFNPTGLAPGITLPAKTALTGDGSQRPQQTVFRIAARGNLRDPAQGRERTESRGQGARQGQRAEQQLPRHLLGGQRGGAGEQPDRRSHSHEDRPRRAGLVAEPQGLAAP